jgi:2-polyprenyl-6-methoxyphenol hydroxylase-like FAD-dependent oxidoreductase
MKAIIVGAGIGGLTTALFLNKHGIDCEVFEQAPAIQELLASSPTIASPSERWRRCVAAYAEGRRHRTASGF